MDGSHRATILPTAAVSLAQIWHGPCPTCHRRRLTVLAVSSDARHRLGQLGEELAGEHLARSGFRILERNYRTRWGELDIIAFDGGTLVFCEVKTRRLPGRCGQPFDAVPAHKRAQVRKMASRWLRERSDRPYAGAIRFDAIGVLFDRKGGLVALEHLAGAF